MVRQDQSLLDAIFLSLILQSLKLLCLYFKEIFCGNSLCIEPCFVLMIPKILLSFLKISHFDTEWLTDWYCLAWYCLALIAKPDCLAFHYCTMLSNISMCIQCVFIVYSMCIQCLFNVHSMSIQCIYYEANDSFLLIHSHTPSLEMPSHLKMDFDK